jgi:hypothetical protein
VTKIEDAFHNQPMVVANEAYVLNSECSVTYIMTGVCPSGANTCHMFTVALSASIHKTAKVCTCALLKHEGLQRK